MTNEARMLGQIGEREAWLRQAMPPDSPPSFEPLKLRVRIAAQETWLAQAAITSAELGSARVAELKSAVRAEVSRVGLERALLRRRVLWRGGFAMAAAVLLALLLVRPFIQLTNRDVEAAIPQKLEDLIDTLQTTSEPEFDDLEADIVTLTESLADSTSTAWREHALDQLGGELESLVEEIGS